MPHWLGPHSIIYTTLSRALDLSNGISLLDPLFMVAPVTVVNYFLLPHPNGLGDPRNPNPSLRTRTRKLCSFSSMNKTTDLNEEMEEIGKSQQPSLSSADPLPALVQPMSPGSNPRMALSPGAFRGHLLQSHFTPPHDPHSCALSRAPASQGPFASTDVERCSSSHLWISLPSALICGRRVEAEPQPR